MNIDFDKYNYLTLKSLLECCLNNQKPGDVYYADVSTMFPTVAVAKQFMDVLADYDYNVLSYVEGNDQNFRYKKGIRLQQFYEIDLLEIFKTYQSRTRDAMARNNAQYQADVATIDAAQSSKIAADASITSAKASMTSATWAKRSGWITGLALLVAAGSWLRPAGNDDIKDLQKSVQSQQDSISVLSKRMADVQDSVAQSNHKVSDTVHLHKALK